MDDETRTSNNKISRKADPARGKRLFDAIREAGLTQAEVARRVGVNAQSMWKLKSGKGMPSDVTLEKLCRELRISPEWYLFGRGEKRASRDELDGASYSMPTRGNLHPGLRQWLMGTPAGRETTTEERAWLRSIPWPDPGSRAPDRTYELMLEGYREMVARGGNPPPSDDPPRGGASVVVVKRGGVRRRGPRES